MLASSLVLRCATCLLYTTRNDQKNIVQSIFGLASRRYILGDSWNADRRDGELKMGWTKPLHDKSTYLMGIEWTAWYRKSRQSANSPVSMGAARFSYDRPD